LILSGLHTALQIELSERTSERYAKRVNPEWVRLLDLLQMNVRYERCVGVELFIEDGRRILDFLSGYCVHNVGHNQPDVVRICRMERCGPAMIQTHLQTLPGTGGEVVATRRRPKHKAFFCSSGSEGVEAATACPGAYQARHTPRNMRSTA
jgi:ornithine--oxo-acid transaminase